jgi:hypothetical protein
MRAMGVSCNQLPQHLLREAEKHGVEGAIFVKQLRTENQTINVARVQNGCTRTTLPRNFK